GAIDINAAVRAKLLFVKRGRERRDIAVVFRYQYLRSAYIIGFQIELVNIGHGIDIKKTGVGRNSTAAGYGKFFQGNIHPIAYHASPSVEVMDIDPILYSVLHKARPVWRKNGLPAVIEVVAQWHFLYKGTFDSV